MLTLIMKKKEKLKMMIFRNEQDAHMFDTEDQELKEKATKEEELGRPVSR